ncbi:MAG: glucuronate isomerase [Bacteroidales bacterium OttesenSCG-928-I14]|jgi:glucuronate isomerase|nr:glucuronate isomerase [Bacteroidales bacterium OttesenSCG-928-I14]
MRVFMDDNFLLQTDMARQLYHEFAAHLPIIDYHCHISPKMIANDRQFDNLGQVLLEKDHYKWRAMRANGVEECYITGESTSDFEKFEKWIETIPYTMRNPLYHWAHMELKTVFGINEILKPEITLEVYNYCTDLLRTPAFSFRNIMKRYNVDVVCTTDDPADSLEHHIFLQKTGFEIKILPTWRPDNVLSVENPLKYREYIEKLSYISGVAINCFDDLLEALKVRHDFFSSVGCKSSDHGLDVFYAENYKLSDIDIIFNKIYNESSVLNTNEIAKFKSCLLIELAKMDWGKGWVQQFHYGALRNNNTRMFLQIGVDSGYDSIGDWNTAESMSKFLDQLDKESKLARTILYNLNPRDNEMVAAMTGNFQDCLWPGKIQFGSGWWFLDQKIGIENQINTLSVFGLLSRFIGMLTDSRSILSYTRHEYFRRILCNLVGSDIEQGLLPASELSFIGKLIENVSYYNAKNYFEF